MKSKQSGITLIGFLIIVAIVGFLAYMGMKLLPSYSEYMGVVKAMNQVATEGTNGKSLDEIRRDLMFKMGFQYVDDATIKPANITIIATPAAPTRCTLPTTSRSRSCTTSTSCCTSTRACR